MLAELYERSEKVYEGALEYGFLQNDAIYFLTEESIQRLEEGIREVLYMNTKAESEAEDCKEAQREAIHKLEQVMTEKKMEISEFRLRSDGYQHPEVQERFRKDYFFASPAIQNMIREQLDLIESAEKLLQKN